MAKMMEMMKMVVPDGEAQVEAARNNFMLKMPGECVQGTTDLAKCTISRTVTVPEHMGATTQTITENTVITIRAAPDPPGK